MHKIYMIPVFFGILHLAYFAFSFFYPKKRKKTKSAGTNPSIEHIVCFKNESRFIEKKLENCYRIDYPSIHHTFINDNSTDDTLDLLKKFSNDDSDIINNPTNLGKNQSQISAVKKTKSELLLFTDANVFLHKDALHEIVKYFDDEMVGVCGNVTITTDLEHKDISGKYWQIEKRIKEFQTLSGSVIGFDGGFYCVKRRNYYLRRENELSDFETAFLILEQKLKTGYASTALADELEKRTIKSSFKARMRASNRVFWSYSRIFKYIWSLRKITLLHFFFHKLLRYLLILSFVLSLPFLIYDMIKIFPLLPVIFFIPYVFRITLESIALFTGGIIALFGKEYRTWSDKKS